MTDLPELIDVRGIQEEQRHPLEQPVGAVNEPGPFALRLISTEPDPAGFEVDVPAVGGAS